MDTGQYDFVEAILTAHQIGRREGFENALDVRQMIEDDEFSGIMAGEDFSQADAIYLEALAAKQQELEGRIALIEKHYLGVEFTPELIEPALRKRGCDDPSCECSDTTCA